MLVMYGSIVLSAVKFMDLYNGQNTEVKIFANAADPMTIKGIFKLISCNQGP